VSMLPTVDGRLFQIQGGDFQLPAKLLGAAAVELIVGTKVTAVERDGSVFHLHLEQNKVGPYAAVILAAPLEQCDLKLIGLEALFIPKRRYQTTVTTIVRGRLRATYFGAR